MFAKRFGKTNSDCSDSPAKPEKAFDPIWKLVALPKKQYEALYLETIRLLSEHHDSEAINNAISYSVRALKIRRGIILPPEAEPEDIRKQEHLWTYATFITALYRDLGITGEDGIHTPPIAEGWLTDPIIDAIKSASKGKSSPMDGVFNRLPIILNATSASIGKQPVTAVEPELHIEETDEFSYIFATQAPLNPFSAFGSLAKDHMDEILLRKGSLNQHGSNTSHSGEMLFIEAEQCESLGGSDFSTIECFDPNDVFVGYGDWVINERFIQKGIGLRDLRLLTNIKPVTLRKCKPASSILSEIDLDSIPGNGVDKLRDVVSMLLASPFIPPINELESVFHQRKDEVFIDFHFIKEIGARLGIKYVFGAGDIACDARNSTYSCACKAQGRNSKKASARTFHAVVMRGLKGQMSLSEKGESSVQAKINMDQYTEDLVPSLLKYVDDRYSDESTRGRTKKQTAMIEGVNDVLLTSNFILEYGKRVLKLGEPNGAAVMDKIATDSLKARVMNDLPFGEAVWKFGALRVSAAPLNCMKQLESKRLK